MKKIKLLVVLLITALIIPFVVHAEEVTDEQSNEVKVYLFRGEGCPHCEEAIEWFASIEEEYGAYFKVIDYETWYNEENAALMQKVAEAKGDQADGVPYIIIGNKSWNGFTESYEEGILSEIKSEFAKDVSDRYDIMEKVSKISDKDEEKDTGSDVVALIVILIAVSGICFGIYKARTKIK
ncbi:MAG: hypothetical protein IJ097_05125 [Bacilli bacterium]|nr:hypothetical protein [Bacilli bacterium]